ncbi:hypothetical protein H310_04990 [Aphanomyces invadans]|uniref:Glycoside hydrolase family 5 domain-containing protein n=1 Tax=Aphanomyces invadans TaxID=157072 RepID=A0A024UCF9_9STRA|nr:hypothetical protein H310_04990 [Aphanomyces invadans]ETW03577.1 hypothetical protein H310_04990 [Aphanomyces invadans]|eukprot:XP_008867806.1 hypothetical protein H310_04990 [Aphanomyces invadans]
MAIEVTVERTAGSAATVLPVDRRDDDKESAAESGSEQPVTRSLPTIPCLKQEAASQYKGRYLIWPGMFLLGAIAIAGVVLMVIYSWNAHHAMNSRRSEYNARMAKRFAIGADIDDGSFDGSGGDDGESPRNPSTYGNRGCALPNYVSTKGQIFALGPKGESVPIGIKGINWFGMETGLAIPFGLWANDDNGTTVYEVARFLAKNRFNSVRLPLCVSHLLTNRRPQQNVINIVQNKAINATTYMSTLSSIVQTLAFRNISVLLDMHSLTSTDSGGLPWTNAAGESAFMDAVDVLTTQLCNAKHWNIVGLDLKNEPHLATWGDGGAADFRLMAQRIGNRMLTKCPSWLAFVEGINTPHTITIDGETFSFTDWWGGGLEGASANPVELGLDNKIVYAPHYYNPAVYPQLYYLKSGTRAGDTIIDFQELDDGTLAKRVQVTSEYMFGHLRQSQDGAIVLGEFGGLYTQDAHPMRTTQRATEALIEIMKEPGYAGGYLWALNPESAYQFNPSNKRVTATEGLLDVTWLNVNEPFLKAMAAMDSLPNLRSFPCFPTT